MHPENVKIGARMEQFGARIVPTEVAFCYVKNRRPNCRRGRKIKTAFPWAGSVPIFEGCFPL